MFFQLRKGTKLGLDGVEWVNDGCVNLETNDSTEWG